MTDPNIVLAWTDAETTGLDYENDLILEVAWQFTDFLGQPLNDPQTRIVIDYGDEYLMPAVLAKSRAAPPVVRQMHLDNGLWNDVLFNETADRSNFFRWVGDFEDELAELRGDAEVRFAGSTVGFDKRFLETVNGGEFSLSHRVLDLSSYRPFCLWQGIDLNDFSKDMPVDTHRGLADIEKDIAQWRGFVSIFEDQ